MAGDYHTLEYTGKRCMYCEMTVEQIEKQNNEYSSVTITETMTKKEAEKYGYKVEDTEPSGEWVREFDKEFFNVFNWIKLNCKDEIISGVDINKIDKILKARIHSLLLTQRSKLVEAAEGMKMKNTKDESNSDWFYGKGYNNALDDVLAHLKSNLK